MRLVIDIIDRGSYVKMLAHYGECITRSALCVLKFKIMYYSRYPETLCRGLDEERRSVFLLYSGHHDGYIRH